MKTEPIVPAQVEVPADGRPTAPGLADFNGPRTGAEGQAWHALPGANGLPGRWQGRDAFTVLATGSGLGHDFLATWDAWRRDPARCGRLGFVAVERHPSDRESLRAVHRGTPLGDLASLLADAWPPATPDLHRLVFDGGHVELLLACGEVTAWLRELDLRADAILLDGSASEAGSDGSEASNARLARSIARLAAGGATLATRAVTPAVRRQLASTGFEVGPDAGTGEITLAAFRPVHTVLPSARRAATASAKSRVLIVGGGLAGTATAAALAERGRSSTLYERGDRLAAGASGNPAGLFHGTLHAADGPHARFARAAALAVAPVVARAVAEHGVAGSATGFLRIESRLDLAGMQALLARSALPAAYVEALDAETASALAGVAVPGPAWHYPQGGWVDPAGLVRAYAAWAGPHLDVETGVEVASIRRAADGWQLLDAGGQPIDAAETLVLANAGDALRLLGNPDWTVGSVRGQISRLPAAAVPERLRGCLRPLAGSGYMIPTPAGLVFGATQQHADDDPSVRRADHAHNVVRLEALVGSPLGIDTGLLTGRTAWRHTTRDRLPLVGPVPALAVLRGERAVDLRWNAPRHVPREPGLHLLAALGSRGITASALGAQVLAAGICGTPVPLESGLVDAIDPARFVSRALRSNGAAG